jgi:hypothetical protein
MRFQNQTGSAAKRIDARDFLHFMVATSAAPVSGRIATI